MSRVFRTKLKSSVIGQMAVCRQAEVLAALWRKISKANNPMLYSEVYIFV